MAHTPLTLHSSACSLESVLLTQINLVLVQHPKLSNGLYICSMKNIVYSYILGIIFFFFFAKNVKIYWKWKCFKFYIFSNLYNWSHDKKKLKHEISEFVVASIFLYLWSSFLLGGRYIKRTKRMIIFFSCTFCDSIWRFVTNLAGLDLPSSLHILLVWINTCSPNSQIVLMEIKRLAR